MARLSADLAAAPFEALDAVIARALRKIVYFLDLDRSAQFLFLEDGTAQLTHTFSRKGFPIFNIEAPTKGFPWVASQMLQRRVVHFNSVNDLPEETAVDRETVRVTGPLSNATFPLFAGGRVFGALAATLAHELSQPLAAILSNTQAVQRLLQGAVPGLAETQEALTDIVSDVKRAAEVSGECAISSGKDIQRSPRSICGGSSETSFRCYVATPSVAVSRSTRSLKRFAPFREIGCSCSRSC